MDSAGWETQSENARSTWASTSSLALITQSYNPGKSAAHQIEVVEFSATVKVPAPFDGHPFSYIRVLTLKVSGPKLNLSIRRDLCVHSPVVALSQS
jgi:hypothetical protein